MKVLLGEKLGMTRIFDDHGRAVGVTAVKIWDTEVVRLRDADKDGYEAMQLGAGEARDKKLGKARLGQSKGKAFKVLREFPKASDDVKPGTKLGLDQFEAGERVIVTAVSKGKGFQGTVKRHNFSRGPKTHGSRNYRAPGSVGGTGAARVFAGQKMPGRMGNETVTMKNVRIADIDTDEQVLLLAGSVPGPTGQTVAVTSRAVVAPAEAAADAPAETAEEAK